MTSEALYSVAAVVKLTGLSPNTLRTWERRHGAVRPRRDESGHRVFTANDVERLRLLKELSANGEPVRRFAGESLDVLRAQAEAHRSPNRASFPSRQRHGARPRVAILHGSLLDVFAATSCAVPWEVVFQSSALRTFLSDFPAGPVSVDVLVADLGQLGHSPVEAMAEARKRCGATNVVVTYDFAASTLLGSLRTAGARLVRGPLDMPTLLAEVRHAAGAENAVDSVPPPRRFDALELARLRSTESAIECECPRQLATLVTQLVAFEEYSASCARNNIADAMIHSQISLGVAHARNTLETLLSELCAHEGFVAPPPDARLSTASTAANRQFDAPLRTGADLLSARKTPGQARKKSKE